MENALVGKCITTSAMQVSVSVFSQRQNAMDVGTRTVTVILIIIAYVVQAVGINVSLCIASLHSIPPSFVSSYLTKGRNSIGKYASVS